MKTFLNNTPKGAYRFFHEHAGWVVGQKALGAWQMMQAERVAEKAGCTFEWEPDSDADMSFVDTWPQKEQDRYWKTDHYAEACIMRDAEGNVMASLYGIIDADSNCRRVIEAELALEALPALEGDYVI